jgi:hypothetical protein
LKADILQGVPVSFSSGGAMALLMLMAVGAMIGRGMFVSAWNVDYIPGKINNDPGFFEEIKPQEAFNGALRGKIVTDDFHIFNFNPKGPEFGDNDEGNIFNTASCGYFDLAPRAQRIASYGDGGLNGDDGVRGPGIHGHLQRKLNPLVRYLRVAENNGLPGIKSEFGHGLESGRVAFGKRVFGIFHQQLLDLGRLKQNLVDVFPVGAVGDNFSGNGRRRCSVEFVNGNEEPFAGEPFFHFFNLFGLHIFRSGFKGNMAGRGCQARIFAV